MISLKVRSFLKNALIPYVPNSIPLEQLEEPNSIYEPEQFPAAIVRSTNPKASYLLFNSGKIIITGVKTEEELQEAAEAATQIAARAEKQPQDTA
jgi:TATA-box binding protein (TBP) (component of TFIID and TFIIIB)